VVAALAPNRQTGVQVRGRVGAIEHAWGAFNGNQRQASGNDNDDLMVVGRVAFWPTVATAERPGDRLEIAVNAAHSKDADATIGNFIPSFAGTRSLWGADARWTYGKWLVAAEGISSRFDPVVGPTRHPAGFHGTLGYMTSRRTQLLARWDDFDADGIGAFRQKLVVLGWNFWPTRATEVQINSVTSADGGGLRHQQGLVNFQVAF
jgi:phosphate-selective porin